MQEFGYTGTFFILTDVTEREEPGYMTYPMLQEMAEAGMHIEVHGREHFSMKNRGYDWLHYALLGPIEHIDHYLGYQPRFLAYPSGDYDQLVIDMAKSSIYPAAIKYLSSIAAANSSMAAMNIELGSSTAKTVAAEADAMMTAVEKLSTAMEKHDFASTEEHMQFCANGLRSLMEEVRSHADALEAEVADELWPLPKYREMLFIK